VAEKQVFYGPFSSLVILVPRKCSDVITENLAHISSRGRPICSIISIPYGKENHMFEFNTELAKYMQSVRIKTHTFVVFLFVKKRIRRLVVMK
jgi:hypothetical protein